MATVAAHPLPPAPTAARLVLGWHLDPYACALLVLLAGGYLAGVRLLARRGERWPRRRTALCFAGVLVAGYAQLGGLAGYGAVLFSARVGQQITLALLAPALLVLGRPVTLLRHVRRQPVGASRAGSAAGSALAVGAVLLLLITIYAEYLSGLAGAALRVGVLGFASQLVLLAVGCLFFAALLGRLARAIAPFWVRLLLLVATLPYYAILGLTLMNARSLVAGDYYARLHRPWSVDLRADQHLGGGLLWAAGDVVAAALFAVVSIQWVRAEDRRTRAEDARLDLRASAQPSPGAAQLAAGELADADLAAYNAMLRRLAGLDAP